MDSMLFYDIEVFKEDALVIFKNIDKEIVAWWHNDFLGLREFVKGKVLVGYNNYWYDDKVLARMIDCHSPIQIKKVNDDIIGGGKVWGARHEEFESLDAFQQIDAGMPSLKKIEGNFGKSIIESVVPFDLDRKLTEDEFTEVFDYCAYDIDTTIDIYKLRENSYFRVKKILVGMLDKGIQKKALKWNTTTIASNILLGTEKLGKWSGLRIPEWMLDLVDIDVLEMWGQVNKFTDKIKVKSIEKQDFGCNITFGFGGLHGVHNYKKRVKNVKLLDVTSMYPNIILLLDVLGVSGSAKYRGILEQRIKVKHTDKGLSDALKLILNSAYGNLNNKYSGLYNPRSAYSVCVYGQIALYELCRRLSVSSDILNINTDGVIFETDSDDYKDVWKQWEIDFGLNLEEKKYKEIIQRDVNNYIVVQDDGSIVTKGDTSRYSEDAFFKNNNARIIDIGVVDYLVYDKPVLDSVMGNLDKPELYQYILKAGGTFLGTVNAEDEMMQKVNRVFAVKDNYPDVTELTKKRKDGGKVKFADAPDMMGVFNGECTDIVDFESVVDINHYYKLCKKKLEGWGFV